jgi:hypothetical protein
MLITEACMGAASAIWVRDARLLLAGLVDENKAREVGDQAMLLRPGRGHLFGQARQHEAGREGADLVCRLACSRRNLPGCRYPRT